MIGRRDGLVRGDESRFVVKREGESGLVAGASSTRFALARKRWLITAGGGDKSTTVPRISVD